MINTSGIWRCLTLSEKLLLFNTYRNKMSGIPVKNQRKKPRGLVKKAETNSCKITQK